MSQRLIRAPRPLLRAAAAPISVLCAIVCGLLLGCAKPAPLAPGGPSASTSGGPGAEEARKPVDYSKRVLVALAAGADAEQVADDYDASILDDDGVGYVVLEPGPQDDSESLAAALATDPRVAGAEVDGPFEAPEGRQVSVAFDDGVGSPEEVSAQPGALALGFAGAHAVSRGAGVRVAILDTGADLAHPLLAGRVVGGWDFVDGDADPTDVGNGRDDDRDGFADESFGHGTHVAGVAAAAAPEAELLVVRVLDADGRGDFANVAAGIRWAMTNGARVLNLSLGGLQSSNAVQDELDAAEEAGAIAVVSGGNWGATSPEEFPARSSHARAVAAVHPTSQPAGFSSFGQFIAISAPGVAVRSAYPGGRYASWSGTSMATPFVSATAALLMAVHPDWDGDMVMGRLRETATPVDVADSEIRALYGAGVVNAAAALAAEAP